MDISTWIIPFLDFVTVGLCVVCKLPQVLAIVKSKNVKGISLTSVIVELFGYSIVFGYNVVQGYPLPSYLEYPFLVLEDIALLFVIFYYLGEIDLTKVGGVGVYLTVFYGFTKGVPHPQVLPFLMRLSTPISASSKIMQLKEIWRSRNSDSVSVLTWGIAAFTCFTRIVSNLMSTGDLVLLINYGVGFSLNTAIIVSALYFRTPKLKMDPLKVDGKAKAS